MNWIMILNGFLNISLILVSCDHGKVVIYGDTKKSPFGKNGTGGLEHEVNGMYEVLGLRFWKIKWST